MDNNSLEELASAYVKVHGYLALVVCVIGVVVNAINIIVLSHSEMRSPINRLLQSIAVADLVTMVSYIPYVLLYYIINGTVECTERNTQGAATYLFVHANATLSAHTASIWLTVAMALFRYIHLSFRDGKQKCNLTRANITIVLVVVFSVLVIIPQIAVLRVQSYYDNATATSWYIVANDRTTDYEPVVSKVQSIIMAVLVKTAPSILLIILSALLIKIVLKAHKKYRNIQSRVSSRGSTTRDNQTHRTTRMLLAVAIMFTLTELPQGILFVLSALSKDFYDSVMWPLGNLMDLLAMVSCCINFVLYCIMSAQFRTVFIQYLKALKCTIWSRENNSLHTQNSAVTNVELPDRVSNNNNNEWRESNNEEQREQEEICEQNDDDDEVTTRFIGEEHLNGIG